MPAVVASQPATPTMVRLVMLLGFLIAAIMVGVWLWSRACMFPAVLWNDMRLAAAVAFTHGETIYATVEQGTINTWTYGPLPLLVFAPASLAPNAATAMITGGCINLAVTLVPLGLVCFMWPVAAGAVGSLIGRGIAFLLCICLWPGMFFSTLFSDNVAIACGLIGNLVLVRAGRPQTLWVAAFAATAAVACKQTALGIPLAQVLWVGITSSRRSGLLHAGRCVAAGAILGVAAITKFGWNELWFTTIQLPAHFGWRDDIVQQLRFAATDLVFAVFVPFVIILLWRRAFARPELLLPALAWASALPLGLIAILKPGGWTNSIHGHLLWLPPLLTYVLAERMRECHRSVQCGVIAMLPAVVACARVLFTESLPLRPQIDAYREAEQFAPKFRGRVWFPLNPMITLYSDGRYYHDEDGFHVRQTTRLPITQAQAVAHLPSAMHMVAFRTDWNSWGIARTMMPAHSRTIIVGGWTLIDGAQDELGR